MDYLTKVDAIASATHYNASRDEYYRLQIEKAGVGTLFWEKYCQNILRIEGRNVRNASSDTSSSRSYSDYSSDNSSDEEDDDKSVQYERLDNSDRLQMAEVVTRGEAVPLRIKYIFRFDPDQINKNSGGPSSDRLLLGLIHHTQAAIVARYQVSNEREMVCCVFKPKKMYRRDGHVVAKIILQFPYIRVNYTEAKQEFGPTLLKALPTSLFNEFSILPKGQWVDIVSFEDMKEHYPMYLADDTVNPSFMIGCYEKVTREDFSRGQTKPIDPLEYFDPKVHSDYIRKVFIPSTHILYKKLHILPMFYTKSFGNVITKIKISGDDGIATAANIRFIHSIKDTNKLKDIKDYLNMIDVYRLNIKHSWESIGMALYSSFKGHNTGLRMWKRLTQESSEFEPDLCNKAYKHFIDNDTTYRTIAWYAKCDSPIKYDEKKVAKFVTTIRRSMGMYGTKDDKIDALSVLLDLEYMYYASNSRDGRWYRYKNHHWEELAMPSKIYKFIRTTYMDHLKEMADIYLEKYNEAGAADENKKSHKANWSKMVLMIKEAGDFLKKGIMIKALSHLRLTPKFGPLLDQNYMILGVRNGVVECNNKEAFFREGKPEDFISKQTGVRYDKKYNYKSKRVKEVVKWFTQLYPDPKERNYFIKILCSFLRGRNRDKNGYFMVGSTNGCKSTLMKFLGILFKNYISSAPESEITVDNNKSKGGPNPAMAMAMDNNLLIFNEVGGVIDEKAFKRMTGEDKMYNRKLNDNGGSKIPRFKPLILSNFPPLFRTSDNAIFERVILLYLKSVWVHNAPKSEEEQFRLRRFKRDNDFDLQLNKMASAALWLLVNEYQKYRSEGLVMPKTIENDLNEYWRKTDIIGSFITDKVGPVADENNKKVLVLERIEEEYKKWMDGGFPDITKLDKSKLLVILKQRFKRYGWSEYNGTGWPSLKIKHRIIA